MAKLTNEQFNRIDELVEHYQLLTEMLPNSGILRDARYQHIGMANGGDGGATGNGDGSTIRSEYYKGQPNAFFQCICERMRWEY